MELKTISQVSKAFHVSTRTLRYYEQIGLLPSVKKEDYAYRSYDSISIRRLQQIIVLRKLRIPLRQIQTILQQEDSMLALQVFEQNVAEIEDELIALSTIKSILHTFIERLNQSAPSNVELDLLNDEALLKIVDSLTVTKINFKEEKSMEELTKATESVQKLKDVRIVYLPPATVAASHYIGENPEENAGKALDEFVRNSGLCRIKPDVRHFGFNHPNPSKENEHYGYEMWVTIPEDMEVPAPLMKKFFPGGLYAAHMIPMGAFEEWAWLYEWVQNSDQYECNFGEHDCMDGLLEEHLNYIGHAMLENTEPSGMQLDLLFPIKEK